MADNNEIFNGKDTTAEYSAQDIEQNKLMAVLAYLSILVLVPLFAAKDSKFARFHCNQGLLVVIGATACIIILSILALIPFIGLIFGILDGLVSVVYAVYVVLGIINAATGKAKELPIIGKYRILK